MYIFLILILIVFLFYFIYWIVKKNKKRPTQKDNNTSIIKNKSQCKNEQPNLSIDKNSKILDNPKNDIQWVDSKKKSVEIFKNSSNKIDFEMKIKSTPKIQQINNNVDKDKATTKGITISSHNPKYNKFTLFDVETANDSRSSICQIAFIVIENNKILKSESHFVRPIPFLFDTINTSIHGITRDTVKDAKTFKELWPLISDNFTSNHLVIAHNAGFDISCLRSISDKHKLDIDNFSYLCSRYSLAKVDPSLEKHSLEYLSNKFKLTFNHHDALDDTKIIISIFKKYADSVSEFVDIAASKGYKTKKFRK